MFVKYHQKGHSAHFNRSQNAGREKLFMDVYNSIQTALLTGC
jgi:hypothetical protein